MYRIEYSEDANEDMRELFYFIAYDKGMPDTALKYLQGLKTTIENTAKYPTASSVRNYHSLLQFGYNVRIVNYKKMSVIYTIHEDLVYIHRVIAANMIIN